MSTLVTKPQKRTLKRKSKNKFKTEMTWDRAREMKISKREVLKKCGKWNMLLSLSYMALVIRMSGEQTGCAISYKNMIEICVLEYHSGMCMIAYRHLVPDYKFPDDVNCDEHIATCIRNTENTCSGDLYTIGYAFVLFMILLSILEMNDKYIYPWIYEKEIAMEYERRRRMNKNEP